jgi:membrane fusion protein, multidrug efflux system
MSVLSSSGFLGFLRPETDENGLSSVIIRNHLVKFGVGAGLVLLLAGCKEEKPVEQVIRPVKAIIVQEQAPERSRIFSGSVRARIESRLGFRVAGKITERLVNVGDKVAVGQAIAKLDETDLKLSEDSARAAVESARTRLDVARDALTRAKTLLPNGYIPKATVDQRQLEFDAAKASLESAEAQARQAGNATGYAALTSSKAGTVTAVQAEPGQVVAAGAPVISLAEAGEIEVALSVPEQDVSHLSAGQPVPLRLWANGDVRAEGRVREIGGQADSGSRTYAVRVSVLNPPPAMRLGMTATATLGLGAEAPHIVVPVTALTQVEGRDAVFIADRTTQTVTPRFVETDGVGPEGVKLRGGLKAGDVVVTGGVQFLTTGMKVRLPKDVLQTASAEASPNTSR